MSAALTHRARPRPHDQETKMSVHPLVAKIEAGQRRAEELPAFGAGDTVRVHYRIIEGEKERIQVFEGNVIGIGGETSRRTFTVRKVSGGVGVERIFPLHSPRIAKLEVKRRGRVRRAKLYYLRKLRGKAAKIRERKDW